MRRQLALSSNDAALNALNRLAEAQLITANKRQERKVLIALLIETKTSAE